MSPRSPAFARRALGVVMVLAGASAHAEPPPPAPPTFAAVREAYRASDVVIRDRHGVPIQTVRLDTRQRRLGWVALPEVSDALQRAVVLGEDRRFWDHGGVDWAALARGALAPLADERARGASTLTMQLAGLLDASLARPPGGRSLGAKVSQAWMAMRLESAWTKSQILEAYLNLAPFRGELVGLPALSDTLFGKHPSGLDAQESAIAGVLLRAPQAPADAVARRACALLRLQALPCAGVAARTEAALVRPGGMAPGEQLAPHAARQLDLARGATDEQRRDGVVTTLDAPLQRLAIGTLRRQLEELRGRAVDDGAVVVIENATGAIRAWVGGNGSASSAPGVDHVMARRQAGSTLKPFVYGLALEQRLLTAASLLNDAPVQLATGAGLYVPQNYDHRWHGWVSVRSALGGSLNVPAVRVGAMLGVDAVHARLQALGLGLKEGGGYYGDALALGSAEVTLLGLANAYRALANGGRYSQARLLPAEPVWRSVADPAATFVIGDILADNNARTRTFGLDSLLATRGYAAVKTGTSKDMRDSWCVGYTDRYTVGVWVGNSGGEPMHEINGLAGAAPVWAALVRELHASQPSRPPLPPPGVVAASIRLDSAGEPARREWFVAGTEPPSDGAAAVPEVLRFGIAEPRDGSRFALDPDMPPAVQRIRFSGAAGVWRLDGRRLGRGDLDWSPRPGRHRLELLGPDGRPVDAVVFEVRGAIEKTASAR